MKFKILQSKNIKYSLAFLVLIATKSISGFAQDYLGAESNQNNVQGCIHPSFPLLIDNHATDSLNAGIMNVLSNGDISLDDNVFFAIEKGNINASSATYIQNQGEFKDIKNGSIYHSQNYFKFLNGSFNKQSSAIKLSNGESFLRERNLHIKYQSLEGKLDDSLEFRDASLSSCNDTSSGWRIEAEAINISEVTSRGHIEDLRLKILDKTVLRLPYLPFPATTKRLSGFLEPELNFTSDGLDLFLPYFWVLSKQSDITLAPRILKKRGSGLEVNYRYLSNNNTASKNYLDLLFFPEDKEFRKDYGANNNHRWAFRFKEKRTISNFTTSIDWAKSSDSMVLLDLPSSITNIANQRDHYLTQSISIGMVRDRLSFNIMREGHQSLNPFINTTYVKKPEVQIQYIQHASNLSYFIKTDFSNFEIDETKYSFIDNNLSGKGGERFVAEVGGEILHSLKHVDVSIDGTVLHKKYNLDVANTNSLSSSIPSIKIKISSMFRKLSESDISLISPEFVYQKTNFKDQSMNPIFDLHQRNIGNFNTSNTQYFFGKDRIPDSEFLIGKLKWQKRLKNNERFNIELIKKNELKTSRVINEMLISPIGKDNQIGTNLSFEKKNLKTYISANYSQKRNTLNYGNAGLEISLPETNLMLSRSFQKNIPLLNSTNEIDYAEISIEHLMSQGYKLIGGITKDLNAKKNLESYFGISFENCCLAFKVYASDKRLSKYNFLNFQSSQLSNMSWENMISVENKSRINFEFELKGLTGGNKRINSFFSNAFMNL